ncbi:TonB-dependent receptor [Ferruginibacter albus]|uniref:TonB-dependent receptor n=1 Tax=Ferruginibacter albus TaxID=2875540 RepID=UPI001CC47D64|nr:carboxypeptidase regulatory-like domain-containing protein [Ferruginibacter albus]UAY50951.1 carboxypeptidase regulatory-like domain-containing protein [Ferruginibacter albus]
MKRIFQRLLVILFSFIGITSFSQVTTSSITGIVKGTDGKPLEGATITAVHTPSGTQYSTISRESGVFNLPGLRTGGPYKITIEHVGYNPQTFENINLLLDQAYNIDAQMGTDVVNLSTVAVKGIKRKANQEKTGASTNIGAAQLATLPTINRSITDFTRTTPQSSGTGFAGRDNRMNNVTVDGANLNNNFGLTSDLLPGGGNPISLDAFEEISVNLSPFDVKQSGFTGAGVNAITKSGTNTFHGSAYTAYRNQSFNGLKIDDTTLNKPAASTNKIYGVTLGGPIIKNKLFFFINGEIEESTKPGVTFAPAGGTGSGTGSLVPIDSLKKLSDFLKSQYNFDPGAYDNFPAFTNKNHKIMAKVDWNISNVHKLTVKYSDYSSTSYSVISQSGGINGVNSKDGVTYVPRFGTTSMGFANDNYSQEDIVRTATIELNSNFHGKFANDFIATLTKISSIKGHDGETFPYVDIIGSNVSGISSTTNYLHFGNEPFNGNNNQVVNDVYTVTDNFSYFKGKHTFTAGINFEYQKVGNMFMAGSQGYYVYNSLNDFITNAAPRAFSINYSLVPSQDAVFSANLKTAQLGFYVQDEVNIQNKLKLTMGLRVDEPIYPEAPLENPAITALQFYAADGSKVSYNGGKWPNATPLLSPRVGFRWDVKGDKSLIVRGGVGIFTGRIPFVFLTNVPSSSGMYTFGTSIVAANADMSQFKFNPDPHAYNPFYNNSLDPSLFPTKAGTVAPSSFALIDPNFKFPQVWRLDLAVEKQLGKGWTVSGEALITKNINDPFLRNATQQPFDTVVNVAPNDVRGRFSSANARTLYPGKVTQAIILENASLGYSCVYTALLAKTFTKGFYASLSYTYTIAKDLSANPGSQAASIWSANAMPGNLNDQNLSYSSFAVPHRIVATFSYRKEYLKHLASTFTFYYEGSAYGFVGTTLSPRYSYTYNGDLNNDGATTSDLIYVPKNASEINFVDIKNGNTVTYTAQQQSDAFMQYVAQDPYLSQHKGEVVKRYGATMPFYHRVDFSFLQDIFTNIGGRKNTLQFNASINNLLNLLNSHWGIQQTVINTNPLILNKVTAGVPYYQLATYQGALINKTFTNTLSTNTTWGLQLGLKYIF